MPSISLSPGQSKNVSAAPEDASGAPGLIGPNAPTWQSSNLSVATVSGQSSDGLSATVNVLAGATPGQSATITLTGANSASQIIASSFGVLVQENPATQFVFSFS